MQGCAEIITHDAAKETSSDVTPNVQSRASVCRRRAQRQRVHRLPETPWVTFPPLRDIMNNLLLEAATRMQKQNVCACVTRLQNRHVQSIKPRSHFRCFSVGGDINSFRFVSEIGINCRFAFRYWSSAEEVLPLILVFISAPIDSYDILSVIVHHFEADPLRAP